MGLDNDGDIAAFGVLTQLSQARADAFNGSLFGVASGNTVAEDTDVRHLQPVSEVDVAFAFVELDGARGRIALMQASRRPQIGNLQAVRFQLLEAFSETAVFEFG